MTAARSVERRVGRPVLHLNHCQPDAGHSLPLPPLAFPRHTDRSQAAWRRLVLSPRQWGTRSNVLDTGVSTLCSTESIDAAHFRRSPSSALIQLLPAKPNKSIIIIIIIAPVTSFKRICFMFKSSQPQSRGRNVNCIIDLLLFHCRSVVLTASREISTFIGPRLHELLCVAIQKFQ